MAQSKIDTSNGPLTGVKILDMTSVVLGPYATQLLADMGAETTKVETPVGDLMRTAGPSPHGDLGPIFLTLNRNKKSIVLDLTKDKAKEVFRKMIADCDIFMTNVRPDGLARLGFTYDDMIKIKPDIIYVHAVGFGAGGAYAGRQAYDDLVQGASGIADLLPKTDKIEQPRFLPSIVADKATGLHMMYATLAALFHHQRTGEGQFVEVPMLEALVGFTLAEHFYGHAYDPPVGQWGYTRILTPNRKPFKSKDGYIGIVPYTDKHWPLFFDISGKPELWDKWRGASFEDRTKNIDSLYALIGEVTQEKTTQEWMTLLDEHDIPCMRINRLEDLQQDPHLVDVNFFTRREHPTEGGYFTTKHPVNFAKTPAKFRLHPARKGADAYEVLAKYGYSSKDIDALIEAKAVGKPPKD